MAPEKLVFIDESGLWVGMSRPLARATKGKKVYELRKSYRGQKMTIICAIKSLRSGSDSNIRRVHEKRGFSPINQVRLLLPKLKKGR
ncbi:transposase [Limnospira indica PCC 8005]|uniref:Transposase n=1 Tax=Limnospira indica PCC 8005 TaxID=376219 RepID=A0A9P1P1L4_9CYAN|nr:transposase [Limnospira indica PCC 8005]